MSLKDTPLGMPEQFNVIVEIPKGSPDKIEYNEDKDEMYVDFVFKKGLTFIYNYGFIPHTLAGDGDTVDVVLLGDKPIPSGSVVSARPIGIVKMLDRGVPDDKVIAVLADEPNCQLNLEEFKKFYAEVAKQKQKTIEITGFEDKDQAIEAIRKAMK